jgi:hypothetical protein
MSTEHWGVNSPKDEKQFLATELVELVKSAGMQPATLDVEYAGEKWEVLVRLKSTKDGDSPIGSEKDFTEDLPE